ncbi:MAG: hypothetical protein AB8G22_25130 [Saprospiraceae bacterium]
MVFKILLWTVLGYFFMRLVFKPKELQDNSREQIQRKKKEQHNDEYVDYEEIE